MRKFMVLGSISIIIYLINLVGKLHEDKMQLKRRLHNDELMFAKLTTMSPEAEMQKGEKRE